MYLVLLLLSVKSIGRNVVIVVSVFDNMGNISVFVFLMVVLVGDMLVSRFV